MYAVPPCGNPSIIGDLRPTAAGWILEATLYGRVPASDQLKLIEWLRDYRKSVREKIPDAVTAFRNTPSGYALEVTVLSRLVPPSSSTAQLEMQLSYA